MFKNLKRKLTPVILPIILIIIWYLLTDGLGIISAYILPGPADVIYAASSVIVNGKLLVNTVDTLFKVFAGLILASIVAIPLGRSLQVFCLVGINL